jgi:hypothetical protein
MDDFSADNYDKMDSVRKLYLDPDLTDEQTDELNLEGEVSPAPVMPPTPQLQLPGQVAPAVAGGNEASKGPLSPDALRAAKAREVIQASKNLRPLRLSAIGVLVKATSEDKAFIEHVRLRGLERHEMISYGTMSEDLLSTPHWNLTFPVMYTIVLKLLRHMV